ncbi:uncharacterized protein KY384_009026 [Bacidia gigantensis]|uniref:uncharacterized protein n=1 Tax=Bacidia gigantensis TaxID=2732470 RepID=UPI001D0387CF|nr:uncharacterized protein KY384_009026 [Bacidia gigantensis]KAG8525382.1 hypothetical protein KY384_009026 [Bacidia gigantensis]
MPQKEFVVQMRKVKGQMKLAKIKVETDEIPFRLMQLPLEIRMMVYKAHLIQPDTVLISYKKRHSPPSVYTTDRSPPVPEQRKAYSIDQAELLSLRLASKAVYNETAQIFFHYNTFEFRESQYVQRFLRKISLQDHQAIRSIKYHFCGTAPAQAAKALAGCKGLQRLQIECSWRTTCGVQWPKAYGIKDLLKVRGIKEVVVCFNHALTPERSDQSLWFPDWPGFVKGLQILKQPRLKTRATGYKKK